MDAGVTIERASGSRDLVVVAAVYRRAEPRAAMGAAELELSTRLNPGLALWLARSGGAAVGAARAGPQLDAPDDPNGSVWVGVDAEHRRHGIGTLLYEVALDHLRALGKSSAQLRVEGDQPDGLAFAAGRGFGEVSREQTVALELTRFVVPEAPTPPGVVVTDLAARPDLLRALWTLESVVVEDVPGALAGAQPPYEAFAQILSQPWVRPELILLALAGDELVGSAKLLPRANDPQRAEHWGTCVRRDWRGRGLAGALKVILLAAAQRGGIVEVETRNELRNEPIRRLNARLGYERGPDSIVMRAPLEPA